MCMSSGSPETSPYRHLRWRLLPRRAGRGRAGRGVAYLVGALVALLVALTLIASPDVVRDAVESAVDWVAGLFG